MNELKNWWTLIKGWGITGDMLGHYFSKLAEQDPEYYGYSSSEISGITQGKKPAKVEPFKRLLVRTFPYDFSKQSQKSLECARLVDYIKKTYGPKKREIHFVVDHSMAQCFQGLYLGIVRVLPSKVSEPIDSPYLFYIKETGDVELKADGPYFREGFITSFNHKIYFFLDSKNKSEPELYITSVPSDYQNEPFKVERFMMCGTWLNRAKKPAYGSTILIKQLYQNSIITSLPNLGDSLDTIPKGFFDKIKNDPNYQLLVEELKTTEFGVYYINNDQVMQFEL